MASRQGFGELKTEQLGGHSQEQQRHRQAPIDDDDKGFPQGGVLSALMWILVADGLLRVLNLAAYFAQGYADDFSILVEGLDLATVCRVMQAALLRVEKWCEK